MDLQSHSLDGSVEITRNAELMLRAESLQKHFGRVRVLEVPEFTVEPGQISVVIGPSGAGKTTLLRALSMVDPPDIGTITLDSRVYRFPSSGISPPPWPQLTVVFQQLFMWPHLTLRQNIELPLQLRGAIDREAVDTLIEEFQMNTFVDRYPNGVSTGERQRAALVRAIALRPRYLLLDEVTSALDVERVALVLRKIQALKAAGVGVVAVTHALTFARRAADAVYFVDGGTVIHEGDGSILSNPMRPRLRQFLADIEHAT
jgi:ABC-type polar amino acid transport system ATPase subunit